MGESAKLPVVFWIIAGVGLLWNIIGLVMFYIQMTATPDMLASTYTEEQVAYLQNVPFWVDAAFGLAVLAGVLGCIALLMRKSIATTLFMVSLAAIIIQNIYNFVIGDSLDVFGPSAAALPFMVIAIAIVLLTYSRHAKRGGLLD